MEKPVRDTAMVLRGQEARPGELMEVHKLTYIPEEKSILKFLKV